MKQLRPYQSDLIQKVREAFAKGFRRILLQAATGSGKSVIFAKIIQMAHAKRKSVLFLVHRRELILQASGHLYNEEVEHGIIMAKVPPSFMAYVQLASIQTLWARCHTSNKIPFPDADIIIIDECFIAGTLIDGKPIEEIKEGDIVTAFNETTHTMEPRRVTRTFKNLAPRALVRIQAGHHAVYCTENHPIYTREGWINAGKITTKHELYVVQERSSKSVERPKRCTKKEGSNILWEILLGFSKARIKQRKNDQKQPYAKPRVQSEDVGNSEKDKSQTENTRRQRKASNHSRNAITRVIRISWFSVTDRCKDWASHGRFWLSIKLQDRLRSLGLHGRDRGRWFKPPIIGAAETGQKERPVLEWARVDNISIYERGNSQEPSESYGDGYVYNFEVEGLHTYIANGIVVHNCHLAGSKTYVEIMALYPKALILGVTATPVRKGGLGLGDCFDTLILGPPVRWLMDNGYLAEAEYMVPDSPDLSKVKSLGGDWIESQLSIVMNDKKLIGDQVSHFKKYAVNKKTLIFATDVAHSMAMFEKFSDNGFRIAHVDGKTEGKERRDIFRDFESGKLQLITNVGIAIEGVDIPETECMIDVAPTKSLGRYLQKGGRLLRPKANGSKALILDHTGNWWRHGSLDEEHDWSLDTHETIQERDRKKEKPKEAGEKKREFACSNCGNIFSGQNICPKCGTKLDSNIKDVEAHKGELVKVDKKVKKEITFEDKEIFHGMLLNHAKDKGYKPSWAYYKFKDKYKEPPNNKFAKVPLLPTAEFNKYVKYLNIKASYGKKKVQGIKK